MNVMHRGGRWKAHPLARTSEEDEDPVRFDFGRQETRVSITWSNDAVVHLVWPEATGADLEEGFFYLEVVEATPINHPYFCPQRRQDKLLCPEGE